VKLETLNNTCYLSSAVIAMTVHCISRMWRKRK